MDFRHTRISLSRRLTSYSKIQRAYSRLIRSHPLQASIRPFKFRKLLNLGCGDRPHSKFINIDYNWIPGVDLCWDLINPLPFPDSSFEGVFSEHCIEHLTLGTNRTLLAEIHRVLKPGGTIRLVVPDAELYLRTYLAWIEGHKQPFPVPHPNEADPTAFSPIMAVNRIFRDYGHLYAYDYDCLALLLRKQGFHAIERCDFRKGRSSELLIDAESRRCESLYVEATR